MSDEYGPLRWIQHRLTGLTVCRSFQLPTDFFVTNLSPIGNNEISGHTVGRTANKGMEGPTRHSRPPHGTTPSSACAVQACV